MDINKTSNNEKHMHFVKTENNEYLSENYEIANEFNDMFLNICQNLAESIRAQQINLIKSKQKLKGIFCSFPPDKDEVGTAIRTMKNSK